MKYLFILDYARLDQGAFLKHFARSLAGLKLESFMMIHADSAYTTRITETGVLTETARIRAVKELNHRLTALFADEGIPLIAINGYQRDTIVQSGQELTLNSSYLLDLGSKTNVLISNLIADGEGKTIQLPLAKLAKALHAQLHFEHIIAFDANDKPESLIMTGETDEAAENVLPDELKDHQLPLLLIRPSQMASGKAFQKAINTGKP
ncbi:hypothetical protein CYPRO_2015 [Cyclonatronum proteinivorum]|uniref:Universal stress protein family protein n=1 Tax=Cyclonatronum proteinivorum TaxID=1457365 RepID=A0A345ULB3_9BACT|nr:hypothetical protein [Cyclonatronum proteinivorum]AXJ01265.1 hypothetical protein CYPRO_2015 [Cyclonatronum proteinivorum]